MSRLIAHILLFLILLPACAQKTLLTPMQTGDVLRQGPYYQARRDGLTLAVEPLSFSRMVDKNLENGALFPVWAVVTNGTDRPIKVTHSQFALHDQFNQTYAPWIPAHLALRWSGPGFSFWYFGPFPFFWWWDWQWDEPKSESYKPVYREWDGNRRLDRNIILPEGSVRAGDSVAGYLLFRAGKGKSGAYWLEWIPDDGGRALTIRFTLSEA